MSNAVPVVKNTSCKWRRSCHLDFAGMVKSGDGAIELGGIIARAMFFLKQPKHFSADSIARASDILRQRAMLDNPKPRNR